MLWGDNLGSCYLGGGRCRFRVWAPTANKVELHLVSPYERWAPLEQMADGYYQGVVGSVEPGALYFYRLGGDREWPDPASRSQPEGVNGPSEVLRPDFAWDDRAWRGVPLEDYIFYELHVGTFTGEGTFEAVIPYLNDLKALGVTALELMPVAQFPGARNWGYDGAYPFAAQNSYGGPEGLKRLVNACHQHGLAVALDVVYNHLGPEGNYLRQYGPYFTECYQTPWGAALNFDQAHSREVRRFFTENALYWIRDCHLDALRLDAVHAIKDFSARPFLEELAQTVHDEAEQLGRRVHLIAESDLNDTRTIRPPVLGGFGLDAQWSDDFHHALHTLLTGERSGYYQDFSGLPDLARAFQEGNVYSGQYSAYRRRDHGNSPRAIPGRQFVVFAQNHDQIGNRMLGERLSELVPFAKLKLAAAAVLLAPYLPLLFMGEEYGETAPFLYFTIHSDPELVEAVRQGRRQEFREFAWKGEAPDPHAEATFQQSKLDHELRGQGRHRALLEFYKELIRLRKRIPALASLDKECLEATCLPWDKLFAIRRWKGESSSVAAFNFGDQPASLRLALPEGEWRKLLDSEETRWQGSGASGPAHFQSEGDLTLSLKPCSFVLLAKGSY